MGPFSTVTPETVRSQKFVTDAGEEVWSLTTHPKLSLIGGEVPVNGVTANVRVVVPAPWRTPTKPAP
jgi:hypothetical protein